MENLFAAAVNYSQVNTTTSNWAGQRTTVTKRNQAEVDVGIVNKARN